ncbi:hypothetical protein SAMN04488005_0632 [Yoonia tamlensis]|uniref:Uncharacterized protein n=1 Tax=Yoonia tamlensis TaxID=390270 RepID=A0A1I6FWG7_9RHOB|nr:hypothetical protein [Yoonia tamlensis]SFR34302.1 hypothetical protein SAMN04488005_0632 [Yoonia tamlensis]
MNATPVKEQSFLKEAIDELVATFGAKKVLIEVTARLFRKIHPPDTARPTDVQVYGMSDHIRKDIGLPLHADGPQQINPVVVHMLNRF